MAKRLSNKQRIERMAEEASIKAEDTAPKTEVRKASRSRKAAPTRQRMKFVWSVVDENAKEMASFPYREKPEAEARAAELSAKTGKAHTVNAVRVPMADNE
ncbi:MAG: hypothetical protein MUC88_10200 [Planctomycetes bacterium]|jgi:hypothetical protein|nr:hypothetical protein [Planctomycetota bacterium]